LAKAKEDSRIAAIYLDMKDVFLSQAKVLMLTQALQDFKTSGKPIYAYAENYNQHAYLIASVADSVFVNPMGNIGLKGYGYGAPFYTQLMERLGLSYKIYYAGEYKGATEPFRLKEFSEQNSYQWKTYLQQLHEILVDEIAANRNITTLDIEKFIDEGNTLNPVAGLNIGLVDGLLYRDQVETLIKESLNIQEINTIDLAKYQSLNPVKSADSSNKIAVVYLEGEILQSTSEYGIIDLKKYSSIFQKIKEDKDLKAVILRINSPGGDGQVSDILAHQIKEITDSGIPVVCSMGTYAASGGYYLAANADYIVAEKSSLTGSIGVFVMFPQVEGFLEDKASIFFDTLQTSAYANGYSPFYNLTEGQEKRFQQLTDDLYMQFKHVVAGGRDMPVNQVDAIAGGRIWTAEDALANNLIDTIGNFEVALEKAKELAGIESYELSEYPKIKKALWEEIVMELVQQKTSLQTKIKPANSVLNSVQNQIQELQNVRVKAAVPVFSIR
jgi:protease-4